MARRLNMQRLIRVLIPVLGVAVLALGGVCLWAVTRGGPPMAQTPAPERALQQVREQMGRAGELRYFEAGEGRALCGYAGLKGQARAVAFVSRPNRILFSDDPLPGEFREMRQRFCPGFAFVEPRVTP